MLSSPFSGPRAGFWRRAMAFTIDCLLIGAVMTILGPLAFSLTGGRIQTGGVGISSQSCVGTTSIPADLDPPPPVDGNHASICTEGTLPFVVSKRYLLVGRRTVSPGRVVDVDRTYPLSALGVPITATDVTWIAQIGFLAYILVCLASVGRTLGMRLLRIRLVVPPFQISRVGVPVSRLLIRIAVAVAGFVPAAAALIWALLAPETAPVGILIVVAIATWVCWGGYNLMLIARKEDPVYDSVAGVAVLIEQSELPPRAARSRSASWRTDPQVREESKPAQP